MTTRYYANGPAHALTAAMADSLTTTMQVDSVSGWPTQFPFTIIIDKDGVLEEICDVTDVLGTTLTVVRGADSSLASAHAAGVTVVHGVSARDFRESNTHINSTQNVHGTTGSLVDTDSAQTITGAKTFTGGLSTTGGDVVDDGSDQTIGGHKTFTNPPDTATDGALVTTGGPNFFVGDNHFNNGLHEVTGPETHTGAESHSGTETHTGAATFNTLHATGAVTADGDLTVAGDIIATNALYSVAYAGTTDANGFLTITHGAGFTPVYGWFVIGNPSSSPAQFWGMDSLTGTTVRLRFASVFANAALANAAVSGRLFLVRP